jgi:hypothetical protein
MRIRLDISYDPKNIIITANRQKKSKIFRLFYIMPSRDTESLFYFIGGERGIRTPGGVPPSLVFKTSAFNHSAISPYHRQ